MQSWSEGAAPQNPAIPQNQPVPLSQHVISGFDHRPVESQGKAQNKSENLWLLGEIPEPGAGLALGLGLLQPHPGSTLGDRGKSAKNWHVGGHVGAAPPCFSQVKLPSTLGWFQSPDQAWGCSPQCVCHPCAPSRTPAPVPPCKGAHRRMLQYQHLEDNSLTSTSRAFPAPSWKKSHVLTPCSPISQPPISPFLLFSRAGLAVSLQGRKGGDGCSFCIIGESCLNQQPLSLEPRSLLSHHGISVGGRRDSTCDGDVNPALN